MAQKIILTTDGYDKLKTELELLKKTKRVEVAARIETAKDFGDLSENAEYHEAKEEQAFIEGRIIEIEHILKVAEIAQKPQSSQVGVGNEVKLDMDGQEVNYHIVGATEADPAQNKISLESPIGQALLDKKVGDSVHVQTPRGDIHYTIKDIK